MNGITVNLTPDQAAACNNALRREIEAARRLQRDPKIIGADEYLRRLDGAPQEITSAYERSMR